MPSVHFKHGTSVKVFEMCHFFSPAPASLFAKMLLRYLTTTRVPVEFTVLLMKSHRLMQCIMWPSM